jgi:hypothetical protein
MLHRSFFTKLSIYSFTAVVIITIIIIMCNDDVDDDFFEKPFFTTVCRVARWFV